MSWDRIPERTTVCKMVVLVGLSSFVIGTQYKCELYKLLIVECAFVTFVLQIKKRLKTFCKVDEK